MKNLEICNVIIEHDRVLGNIVKESLECDNEGKNFAALACLFIAVEYAIKNKLEKTETNFYELLNEAKKTQIISTNEYYTLNQLRKIRNSYFHENQYCLFWDLNGERYPFVEKETMKTIFQEFIRPCLEIIFNLLV